MFEHDVDMEQDIWEFFAQRREDLLRDLLKAGDENITKQEIFKDADKGDAPDIHKLYCDPRYIAVPLNKIGDNYFNVLNGLPMDNHWSWLIANAKYPDPKGVRVLDYGCGPGHLGIKLALMGYDVTLMDINHKVFEFLKYIVSKYNIPNLSFKSITDSEANVEGEYDYIVCSEVLEHCKYPIRTLEHLVEHLKTEGWMYLSTFFNDLGGIDPSHLKGNNKYQDCDLWMGVVVRRGLIPLVKDSNGVEKGYQKVRTTL